MNYSSVTAPAWANIEKTVITCLVKFDDFSDVLPFTASSADSAEWGQRIFAECCNGQWGEISAYSAPQIDHKAQADLQKAELLQWCSESMQPLIYADELGSATEEEKSLLRACKSYCVELYRLDTSQAPDITWPAVPV